ncbi:MAG: TolC family protein [Erythrobacter sp.]|nr:TolC family protein [Erythrobacter sp.]
MNWKNCWISAAALSAASAANAQPIGYEEALRQARVEQPALEARELQVEALHALAGAADQLPDPVLSAGVVNFPVSGPNAYNLNAIEMNMLELGVEQTFPNLAKRNAEAKVAASEVHIAQAQLTHASHDIGIATGLAWIALAYAQQRLDLASTVQAELQGLVPAARSAVSAGSARPAQSLEIRRALLDIDDAKTRIAADLQSAQAQLTRYVPGENPVATGAVPTADLDPFQLRMTLERNPVILLADAQERREKVAIERARADKRPDFGVSASFGRRNPDFGNLVTIMGSVTLPLFQGRRQKPRITSAEAQAMAAAAERQDTLRAITAQFESDLAAWHSALRQWQRARDELLPLARDRADLETASFAAGRADLIDVIAARTALALLELDILEREAAAVEAAAVLRLTYGEHML